MAYALSLSGLLTTCRHHFVQRPYAQCNSIVYASVYVTFARQCNGAMYMRLRNGGTSMQCACGR